MKRGKSGVAIAVILVAAMLLTFAFAACQVQFQLKFVVDGEVYHTIDTNGEEAVTLPADPTKDGYIFDGWYWDEDIWAQPFTAESLLTVKLTGNMSVYAKWLNEDVTKRDYAVTFDTMGYGEVESQRVLYGTLATKPTAPERPGYALVGWYREADLTTVWNFRVDTVTEDTTLYAKWVPSSDAAGCAVIDSGEMTMDGKTLSIELPNAQTTFAFGEQLTVSPYAQYEVSTDLAGKDVIPSATVELEEGDNVFYIQIVSGTGSNRDQYKAVVRRREIYTVTYNFGGGAADATEQVEEDQLAPSKDASREGYTFGGWQHQGEAWDFAADKVVGDMTLTAVWNANGYQVTFDSAGGNEIDAAEVTFGEGFTLEVPTRLGYTFGGWKTEDEVLLTDGEGIGVGAWDIAADTALTATWTVNTYNIEYNNMDGALNAESNPASYTIEDDDITLAAPTKTGYTFVGWTSDEAGEKQVTTLDTSACEDVELWAQWTVNSYTATFVADGETVDEVEFTVEDEALTEPTVPSKVGYTGEWQEYDIVADDITVEAVYTAIVYGIEYVGLEDGTHSNESEYTIERETIVLQDASRVGYDFVGWYDGEQEVTEIASGSHGDKTLTAKWQAITYTISYEGLADGTHSNASEYTIESATIVLQEASRVGYDFVGWYDGEQEVTEIASGSTGDKTLTAKWQAITYTISYDGLMNGTHSNVSEYTIESETIVLQDASRVGYDFVGWYDGEQEVTEIASGSHGDRTLTAKWQAIGYTIAYEGLADGTHSNVSEYTIESETIVLQDASRVGYDFVGWYDGEQEVTEIASGSTGDKTLTAKWQAITYTISYDGLMNGTHSNVSEYTIESETIVLQDASRVGYDFVGWYDGEQEVTEIASGSHGDMTLTAKWQAIVYDITYEYDDTIGDVAEGDALKESYTIEDDFDFISLECFTEGYHFAGWYTEKDLGTGEQVTGVELGTIGDITVYAHWGLEVYDITYIGADGVTSTNPVNYTIESETFTITALTKVGYTFDGWFEDDACEVVADTTIETGTTGDLVFYASWTPIEYTIEYNLYGGGYSGEASPGTYTIETGAELVDPVLDGSFFVGWYDAAEGGAVVTSIEVGEVGNKTLYARWLTFDSEGGSEITGGVSYSADGVTEPQAPTLDWYDFGGWYLDETFEDEYDFALPSTSMTVHALWIPTEYEIEYVLGGGENAPSNPATYNVEDEVVFADASREGYTFNGWYGNAQFTTEQVTGITVGSHGKVTVFASFSINQYTISFETGGGTTVSEITQDYGTAVSAPAQPSKTGYEFVGWYESAPSELYNFTTMPARDFTLYAAWELVTYDIIYNLDGGINGANPSGYTIESATIELADAAKRGYEFVGWFSDSGLGVEVTSIEAGSHGDVELFAGWEVIEYDITYHLPDGATHSNPDFYTVETDITSFEDGVKTGYTFDGWFADADLEQRVTSYGGGAIGAIELWAGFTANEYTVWLDGKEQAAYTIDFDLGGAEGNVPAQVVTAEVGLTVPEAPQWEGRVFAGWYDNAECEGLPYDFSGTVTTSRTLYAKWVVPQGTPVAVGGEYSAAIDGTAMHKVSVVPLVSGNVTLTTTGSIDTIAWLYDAEGNLLKANDDGGADGSNFLIVYNMTAGQEYVLEFRGYSRAASGTATLTVAGRTEAADGGTASDVSGSKVVTFDGEFTLPVPAERDNWLFRGWADEDGVMYTDATGAGIRVWDKAEETVLVSVWEADGFTVSFVTGQGTPVEEVVLPYGARLDVNEYVTTRDGYSFVGWFESSADADPYDASTMPDHDVTLYAKWTTYNLDNIKYDETLKAVSSLRTPTAEDFGATCFDTDDRQVEVTVSASGELVAGTTVTLRLTATSGGKTRTATIRDVKVYGAPTIEVTDRKDYFNLGDGLSAEWFGASGADTYGEPTTIEVYVDGEYAPGDVVTVVIDSVDPAGNVTSESVTDVRVYGDPTIEYDISAAGISAFYDGSEPALGATAADSFGEQLEVETALLAPIPSGGTATVNISGTTLRSYTFTALKSGNVKIYTTSSLDTYGYLYYNGSSVASDDDDGDGNNFSLTYNVTAGREYTVKVRGHNSGTRGTATLHVEGAIESDDLQLEYSDEIGSISDLTAYEGETIDITFTATDAKGNISALTVEDVKVYGAPVVEDIAKEDFKVSDPITVETLGASATDTFGEAASVTAEAVEGTQAAGGTMTWRVTATDAVGNVTTRDFTVWVYGDVTIVADDNAFSNSCEPTPDTLGVTAKDSFGTALDVTLNLVEGELVGGDEVTYTATATDAAGNTATETFTFRVYDVDDIELTYDAFSTDIIKLSSAGEEFSASATDSFGEECAITVERADGGALTAGEVQSVVVVATDAAGNRKVSEPISGVSVYDLPVIEYVRDQWYVEDGEDVTFNFTATDSFGNEVYADVAVEEQTEDYVYVLVTATDDAGNTAAWEGQLRIVPAGGSWLVLYVGDEYFGDSVVEYGENYQLPIAGGGYGYEWSLDGVKLTDEKGNSLAPWNKTSGKYTLTASGPILITYKVTYVLDGGVNAASNPSSYTVLTLGGAGGSIALADPNKVLLDYASNGDGSFEVTQNIYTFLGWYKDASFEQEVTSLTLDLGDVTLYAKWSEPVLQTSTVQVYTREGDYIYFGEYPQTLKADNVTVGDVADEDGYYLGSDGERYAKVVADPDDSGYTFSDGSAVTEGSTYYFKVEPIRWRILSESDGSAFILADGIIANKAYDAGEDNNYKNSDIRAWLNGEFLNTAFGEVAQSLIEMTEVDNSVYSTGYSSNQYACENTFDKVFLLSYREVVNSDYGFSSNSSTYDTARRMTVSDYARSTGAYMYTGSDYFGCGYWWLRSPGNYKSFFARYVYRHGGYVSDGYFGSVYRDGNGVVPALNINIL